MGGIAGVIDFNQDNQRLHEKIYQMQDLLAHRGPDQNGVFKDQIASLAHTRLAVMNQDKGTQPMPCHSEYGDCWLVYHGQLFNHQELQKQLVDKRYSFRGNSDTEVLLNAYLEWGEECVKRLDGVFAFAIWNRKTNTLFFARDRMGVKPFFYCLQYKTLLFASELKALFACEEMQPRITMHGIAEIMLLGPSYNIGCEVIEGITELPPATYGTYNQNGLHLQKYWELIDYLEEEQIPSIHHRLKEIVSQQMIADVPVGALLSGTQDSTFLAKIAAQHQKECGKTLQTFSLHYIDKGIQNEQYDAHLDSVIQSLDTEHHKIVVDAATMFSALFEAVDAHDLPGMGDLDASLLSFYKGVKEFTSVALSTEGASGRFGNSCWNEEFSVLKQSILFPETMSIYTCSKLLRNEFAHEINPMKYAASYNPRTHQNKEERFRFLSPEQQKIEQFLIKAQHSLQAALLQIDQMSMHQGLEVRIPYCDHQLLASYYTASSEENLKETKTTLFCKSLEQYLSKQLFTKTITPISPITSINYETLIHKSLDSLLSNDRAPLWNLVRKQQIAHLWQEKETLSEHAQQIEFARWIAYLLQVNYWLEKWNIQMIS